MRFPPALRVLALLFPAIAVGQFVDAGAAAGLVIPGNLASNLGSGPCFADFDGDGDPDFVMPGGPGQPTRFFRNLGGFFTDQTAGAGLGSVLHAKACVAADVDNDGDQDFYICVNWSPNQLWINDGTGAFVERAAMAGVAHPGGSFTASFGDFNRDGWLDLYVGNYTPSFASAIPEPNILYRNNGNGTFTNVTALAGVGQNGLAFTAPWHDYNEDGWPDLFLGNDKGFYPGLDPDTTYRNDGNGTFTDVGAAIQTNFAIGAMGSDFTDVFNDGGWDIFVSNVQTGHIFHEWDPASATYLSRAAAYGIPSFAEGWACSFLDFDNDRWQDLYIVHALSANHLFRNVGVGVWPEVGAAQGVAVGGLKYSLAVVDYDSDGRMDLFLPGILTPSSLFRNVNSTPNNWLKVVLEGTVSNRDGLGSTVTVVAGGTTQRQMARSGTGYLGSNDSRLHFGLGLAATVDRVIVRWPSGQVQEVRSLLPNQIVQLKEPRLTLGASPVVGTSVPLLASFPGEGGLGYAMALALNANVGLPLGDGRSIPLDPDVLFQYIISTPNNPILPSPFGVLSPSGLATGTLFVPPFPGALGLTIQASAISLDPLYPVGVRTILPALPITLL